MRFLGYGRVSRVAGREGDSFISPGVQREQVAELLRARGHEMIEWIEDLDESGGKWERVGFQRALAMVERGEADGIAVAKLDRFARSLADALRAIERINAVGGELVSVAESFDTTTPMGRAMLQISLVFAELERERQREGFRISKTRAIGRGIHMSTLVPVGYRRGKDRKLVKDRSEAAAVREVFLRRAAGASWSELARYLDKRLPRKGAWTRTTIAKLVSNHVYLGEARQGEIVNGTAHKPIVTRAEWEAAQSRAGAPARRSGSLLSGLLVCGSCGHPLTRVSTLDYGCRKRRSTGVCRAPVTVRIAPADKHVEAVYLEWAEDADTAEASERDGRIGAALDQLEAAEVELAAYRDANLVSVIGQDAYVSGLRERADRVDAARSRLAEAQATTLMPFPHFDAPALWPRLSVPQKRLLIGAAVERVIVSGSTAGLLSDRLHVVFGDDAEGELRVHCAEDRQ